MRIFREDGGSASLASPPMCLPRLSGLGHSSLAFVRHVTVPRHRPQHRRRSREKIRISLIGPPPSGRLSLEAADFRRACFTLPTNGYYSRGCGTSGLWAPPLGCRAYASTCCTAPLAAAHLPRGTMPAGEEEVARRWIQRGLCQRNSGPCRRNLSSRAARLKRTQTRMRRLAEPTRHQLSPFGT